MNYISLINNFWIIDEHQNFNGTETRLYFYLIHLANRSYWKEWVEFGDERLKAYIGVSSAVLRSARNKLQNALLIDFVIGGQGYRVKTRYQILTPNLNPNLKPNLDPLNNMKTNTKQYNYKNGKFSKNAIITNGSDFN
ncbi:MAG: hypothetical protein LBR18_06280 [Tannerella sp.]|jgi:hypothetical protein|nr:hypothetical protein [Tannerella sp.]